MLWSSKMERQLIVEKCIWHNHLPLKHATESMAFYKQKKLICYSKTMMWGFPVSEKQRKRGKKPIHFRGTRRRDFHQVCLVLPTLERNISCFFITLLNLMGTSDSEWRIAWRKRMTQKVMRLTESTVKLCAHTIPETVFPALKVYPWSPWLTAIGGNECCSLYRMFVMLSVV